MMYARMRTLDEVQFQISMKFKFKFVPCCRRFTTFRQLQRCSSCDVSATSFRPKNDLISPHLS